MWCHNAEEFRQVATGCLGLLYSSVNPVDQHLINQHPVQTQNIIGITQTNLICNPLHYFTNPHSISRKFAFCLLTSLKSTLQKLPQFQHILDLKQSMIVQNIKPPKLSSYLLINSNNKFYIWSTASTWIRSDRWSTMTKFTGKTQHQLTA